MTLEELKAEADKLGYRLSKKSERVKFLPCVCGCNRRLHWFGHSYYEGTQISFECNNCGLKSPPGSSEQEARQKWNKMIKEMRKHD